MLILKTTIMPWWRPTGKQAIDVIFGGFTYEELSTLNQASTYIPYMYASLLAKSHYFTSRRTLADVKRIAEKHIYPLRDRLNQAEVQKEIVYVLFYGIFYPYDYFYVFS